jgi:hypothetical protein
MDILHKVAFTMITIKRSIKLKVFQIGLIAIILIGLIVLVFKLNRTYTKNASISRTEEQSNQTDIPNKPDVLGVSTLEDAGLPVSIKIEDINVNALIEEVGLTKDGDMDVPAAIPLNVGWYKLGTRPGNREVLYLIDM